MQFEELVAHPKVEAARALLRDRDAQTLEEQIRLASIPAPTGEEVERGAYVRDRFESLGLDSLAVDEVGNVLGLLPSAAGGAAAGSVVIAAHLDTVFGRETRIEPRRDGAKIFAPGITDNARGLAAMVALVGALRESSIQTARPVLFAATVGEEGLGDLRGVKHLFREGSPFREAAAFITIDGAGLARIVHRAIGACRLRATVAGIGGHSWGDRGIPNPIHAIGVAIARLRQLNPGSGAEFGITVGRIGGGTSINSIASEAWMEIDLRSDDAETLRQLEKSAREILNGVVREEKASAVRPAPLVVRIEEIGARPSGSTPLEAELVQAAIQATREVGAEPELAASSTDANVPIALGIPSVAIGAGGVGGGVHTEGEWYQNDDGAAGVERALLTLLAVAGVR